MRTPATHARHDRPDSQRAAAPLLACTHREDLSRHARALSRRRAARRLLPSESAGSSPARPRLRHHDSARLSARGARLHALDGARAHEPRGRRLEPFGLSLIFNETAVALAGFIAGLPLVVRPLQAAFASPRLIELEEAARIHGASRRDVFLRVTLPLVRPSLAAALLLGSAASQARWASP